MSVRVRLAIVTIATLLAAVATPSPAQNTSQAAIDGILDLFRTHDVVLLGEQHDRRLNYEFRLALLHSPRFAEVVQDIVIESGSSLYQRTLDDFVLALRDVPTRELRQVWRNTTMPTGVWDPPIYEAFIRAVREVNAPRRPERRIRLLAGDPPIDWTTVTDGPQFLRFLEQRDSVPFRIIEREVLARGRKALVIYGAAHLVRSGRNLGAQLEARYPGRAYVIVPLSVAYGPAGIEALRRIAGLGEGPALVRLANTALANRPASEIFTLLRARTPLGSLMDAILYLGPAPDGELEAPPEVENDVAYQAELRRRRSIVSQAFPTSPRRP